jgi:aminoglycoside phosphotransferase (APT) family kinase protein
MTDDSTRIDAATQVREGEAIDAKRLTSFLREHLPNVGGEPIIEQFPAGFSNLTYLLRFGSQEFVLRRPPFGAKIKSAHDMSREYRILSHLYPVYQRVPKPLAFCEDESILGVPFYVMERVKGVILRSQPPEGLDLSPIVLHQLSESFIQCLLEIHQLDYVRAGLANLGSPSGYVERQIQGWTKRYYNARTDDVPSVERLASWLSDNVPLESTRSALIHNDFKYDNLVLSAGDLTTIVAILDWEMATIGDPLMDLGTTLGYWVESSDTEQWQQSGFVLTRLPGNFTREDLFEYYVSRSGSGMDNPVFYYAYGLLKIAVIVQQIYFRFRKGLTKDSRFADLGRLIKACGIQAQRAIEKKRIGDLA